MKKLTQEEKAGAEKFYSYSQKKLSEIETDSPLLANVLELFRGYLRDNFITFIGENKNV